MKIAGCAMVLLAGIVLTGCGRVAVWLAPGRVPETATDSASETARTAFRTTLENGQYQNLDNVTEQLTRAYLAHPNDARTNLYLGMAHLWAVAERDRLKPVPARIIERLALADFYLGEAAQLAPDDARVTGFQAAARMAMGSVHADERWKRMGYFQAKDAISEYPEFNLFVLSTAMAQLPSHDPGLNEAEDTLWHTADVCFGHTIDRTRFDADALRSEIMLAQKNFSGSHRDRACFNSVLAPHNIEGFFLHFGDVLAKNGKQADAEAMYRLASASPAYSTWPYRHVAETRLASLSKHVEQFREARRVEDEPEMMARAGYACVACHQK